MSVDIIYYTFGHVLCICMQDKGVRLLGIRAHDPAKYALALMDAIFSDEEMGTCCFVATKRSTKPPLSVEKVKLIEGMLHLYVDWLNIQSCIISYQHKLLCNIIINLSTHLSFVLL